jgi:hypothetical protein
MKNKTAEEILSECLKNPQVSSKDGIIAAMKQIAKKSFEAGWNRGYEYSAIDAVDGYIDDEVKSKHPNQEQFIKQLFPEQ